MATNVEIIRNFPRSELKRDGWAKSRLASSITPVKWDDEANEFVPTSLSGKLWREPDTGVIMMKPHCLLPDFWENVDFNAYRLGLTNWNYNTGDSGSTGFMGITHDDSIVTLRNTSSSSLVELLADVAIQAIAATISLAGLVALKPVLQTKELFAPNEGFTCTVYPPGIYTERAMDYMVMCFGGKYALHLRMNGTAVLWSNVGTASVPSWKERVEFRYSGGGVEHGKPFQITVIPWGFGYISFLFSQSNSPAYAINTGIRTEKTTSFLYDIRKYEGKEFLEYDSTTSQWIKTRTAPLTVLLREILNQYGFAFARVRYPESEYLYIHPESIPEACPQDDPMVTLRGFMGQKPPSGDGTLLLGAYLNSDGTAWDKTTDHELVNRVFFQSSSNRMYTPELWSIDMELPPEVFTPNWTPQYPDNWAYIKFTRTVDAEASTGHIKFVNDDYDELLHGWGPVRIKVEGTTVFDGYITSKMPSLELIAGSTDKAVVSTQMDLKDMWLRLDEKRVPDYTFLDAAGVLDNLKKLIKRGGFLESDIEVTDPYGYIAGLSFEGFMDPNDQKGFNPDATVGDVIREILNTQSLIPLRVRPIGDKWHIYLAPQYDSSTPPTTKFLLVSENLSDDDRRAANKYYVLSDPEFKCEEPEFNGLIARASEGSGNGAQGTQAVIPALVMDSDSVTNDAAFWFMGRAKIKVVSPPEITMAQSQDELNRLARIYWDRHSKHKFVLEVTAEWSPSLDVDQFVWVTGIDNAGAAVSYGAYRIDSIDVEGSYDLADRDMRWSWQANYTLIYVGTAEDGSTPMFTGVLPT